MNAVLTAVDQELIRNVHRRFVSGVTIVTTCHEGVPRGLAVNAFASISLDPPLILVCVQKTSSTYPSLFAEQYFAVNILSRDQQALVRKFATKDPDKFADVAWHPGATGAPVLDGVSAHLEAEITERLQASTHTAFIGRVVEAGYSDRPPMVYSAGRFYDGGLLHELA